MSKITDILEMLDGRLRFNLAFEGKPAIDIVLNPMEIVIEVKDPIVALEIGIQQIGKKRGVSKYIIQAIKAAGYKVKVKYKVLEFEL